MFDSFSSAEEQFWEPNFNKSFSNNDNLDHIVGDTNESEAVIIAY
jgi:hypothetical protein